jgi:hypothetical protein
MNPAPSKYSVKHFGKAYNRLKNRITTGLKKIELKEGAG